ncbi:peptide-methionine (R)-S-oxide reductase MsrB [Candidatus Micrarchaeota archaeon]|nr:peptide-methionine (R)-S-oxide reductase MsrB [Candidatus Micrarchaeota archaeon]
MNKEKIKNKLTPEQSAVLCDSATEPPFSGELLHNKEKGTYSCAACGMELFSSEAKFDSGTGWPSFFKALPNVETADDYSHGMHRIEVKCKNCGGHLGHVFDDGPTPTGKRYCINSLSLKFAKR